MWNRLFLFFKMNRDLNTCKRIFLSRLLHNFNRGCYFLSSNFFHHFCSQHSFVGPKCRMLMIRLSSLKHIMLLVILSCSFVTPKLHHFKFFEFPLIHGCWSYKSNVSSNRSMIRCTVIADEDTNSTTCPDRVFLLAVKTNLQVKNLTLFSGWCFNFSSVWSRRKLST